MEKTIFAEEDRIRMKKILFCSFVCVLFSLVAMAGCSKSNEATVPPPPAPTTPTEEPGTNPGTNPGEEPGEQPAVLDNDATRRTLQMGMGWNLGNNLDAYEEDPDSKNYLMPIETVWGNPKATAVAIQKVREAGFTTIRIPVTWLAKIGPAPEYKIDAAWMARVTEVVGYALDAGFENIIVDTHHDEDHDVNPWPQCNVINEWLQVFVDAVRASGGYNETRWLSCSTYCANPTFAKYLVLPNDPAGKLMVSVHYYDPSDFTLGKEGSDGKDYLPYSDWGHTGMASLKHPKYDEDYINETFKMLYDTYIANNIPVYIGEIGCSRRDKQKDPRGWAFSLYYMEYVAKAARTYMLPAVLWDCGGKGVPGPEHHYYIRHDTGEYYPDAKEAVDAVLRGWFNDDPEYTLQSVYDSAPVL